jgi:lipopolysaccharide transport system ATP-binding protein
MQPIIEINGLSKKYRLGEIQPYYTLRDSLAGIFKNPVAAAKAQLSKDEFWALKDINFTVNQGEVVGIIGRNGAGKSTLLKILSQITPPTEGEVILRGRVGSLLEVGTGFSPELTGRENIYLNGAVLGMKKSEVKKKFDEIVAFSEVEKFLDTPLKHYSSGMYMRLAFSVAAHLEPDILIVDEVLAVGDAEFQKKCLGKMGEVAGEGRTVLFVSHNMGAVSSLCKKGVLLSDGKMVKHGEIGEVVHEYLNLANNETKKSAAHFFGPLKDVVRINSVKINNSSSGHSTVQPSKEIVISLKGNSSENIPNFLFSYAIYSEGVRLFSTHDLETPSDLKKGEFESNIVIPPNFLRPGDYSLGVGGHKDSTSWLFTNDCSTIEVMEEWSEKMKSYNIGKINVSMDGERKN